MLIDMHAHVVPENFPPASGRASAERWPWLDHFRPNEAKLMIAGEVFRTLHNANWSAERRITDQDASSVDAEVISPLPELLSYWFTPQDGLDISRYLNEFIARLCAAAPRRLFGLGSVPLQDPDLAAKELSSIKSSGLAGIEIGSNVLGKSLGEERFRGFFQEAARLGVPIFVHSLHPTDTEHRLGKPLDNPIGYPADTGLSLASFIAYGTAEACPDLRIAFSHGGGTFPSILPRFMHHWVDTWNEEPGPGGPSRDLMPRAPAEYARRFYYDTLVFDRRVIRYLIDLLGAKQLMIGSDYPYMTREQPVGKTVLSMGLPQPEVDDITWNNCFRFLGIEAPSRS